MKLFCALWGGGHPFDSLPFEGSEVVRFPKDIPDEAKGALVIWGGADISPSIYNREVSTHTYASSRLSERDSLEVGLAKRAIELGMPIIGVCRGAQLLCALAGGYLIQHVNNHGGTHLVRTYTGEEVLTNSIHHQMMYPFDVEHELRAYMPVPRSNVYFDVDEKVEVPCEPEYVYFPKVKGYAVQWHPEGMAVDAPANKWLLDDIRKGIFA